MRKSQKVTCECVRVNMSVCVFTCLRSLRHEVCSWNIQTSFFTVLTAEHAETLIWSQFWKNNDATRHFHQSEARGATNIRMSCPYLVLSPPPPAPRRSHGSCRAPDPGRRSSPPGQRSHKEPGREGDEISRCPIPLFPREQQPSTVRPSLLFANHFILLLFEALACFFLSHFSFLHNPRLLALPLIPGSPRSDLPASGAPDPGWFSCIPLSLSLSLSACSSEMLSPHSEPLSALF